MKYFYRIDTLDALKSEYRHLALENHPDKGGKTETMQEINAEFDLMFRILEKKAPPRSADTETPAEYRKQFYTETGWAGSRYNPRIGIRQIAPIVRGYVKDVYPSYRFSVTTEYFSMGCAIHISLMEAPEKIFVDERVCAAAKSKRGLYSTEEEAVQRYREIIEGGYMQSWEWHYNQMTDKARAVLEDIEALVNSYRYNDSDSQVDYFDTNFYTHFNIGKWDKPLKIVPRRERIQTNKGPERAKRITA